MTLFFWHESSCWVEIRLHGKNQLPKYPGSGQQVCGGGGAGGDGPITLSLQLEMSWVGIIKIPFLVTAECAALYIIISRLPIPPSLSRWVNDTIIKLQPFLGGS